MIYNWFFVINADEFEALDLTSQNLSLTFQGKGVVEVMVTKGLALGLTIDGNFLSLGINDKNPLEYDGYAIYRDANSNIWVGFPT